MLSVEWTPLDLRDASGDIESYSNFISGQEKEHFHFILDKKKHSKCISVGWTGLRDIESWKHSNFISDQAKEHFNQYLTQEKRFKLNLRSRNNIQTLSQIKRKISTLFQIKRKNILTFISDQEKTVKLYLRTREN